MTSNLRPEHEAEVAAKEGAEVVDLRTTPKNSSVTSTELTPTTEQTSARRRRRPLREWSPRKKAKLVGHTTWPQTPQTQPQQIQYTQPSYIPPPPFTQAYRPPMFNYNYNHNWQQQPNPQTQPIQTTTQAQPTQEQLPPPQLTHQSKKTKPQIANPRHYHPSA